MSKETFDETEDWLSELKKLETLEELEKFRNYFKEKKDKKRSKLQELSTNNNLKKLIEQNNFENYKEELNALKKEFGLHDKYYIGSSSTNQTNSSQITDDEWLRLLYERYSERFLKDNDRIWTVTSIFIPLSLAGLSSVKDATLVSTVILGIASTGLICFWYLICEKHRTFQEGHEKILNEIENKIHFKAIKSPIYKKKLGWFYEVSRFIADTITFKINIRNGRKMMLGFVIILWLFTIIAVWCSQKNEEDKVQKKVIIENNNSQKTL